MSYALQVGIEKHLRSKKFPITCEYGPEAFQRRPDHTSVIVERDESDDFTAPHGASRNGRAGEGRYLGIRSLGVMIWIRVKSTVEAARRQDHEDVAEQIADAVQCALYNWGVESKTPTEITGAGYVPKELLPKTYEKWPGVVYLIRCKVPRGVYDSDFDGRGLDERPLDRVITTPSVSLPAGESEPVSIVEVP